MTRKTKIRITVAGVIGAAMAAAFWAGEDPGEVRVTFAGVSAHESNLVAFAFTNSFQHPVTYRMATQNRSGAGWLRPEIWLMREDREIMARSALTLEVRVFSTNRWRVAFVQSDSSPHSFARGVRVRLARYASDHQWDRLGQWLNPTEKYRITYGPEMLGNQPAPPASK
jgi:hypothetical protein